jgi:hypothetical protein
LLRLLPLPVVVACVVDLYGWAASDEFGESEDEDLAMLIQVLRDARLRLTTNGVIRIETCSEHVLHRHQLLVIHGDGDGGGGGGDGTSGVRDAANSMVGALVCHDVSDAVVWSYVL